MTQFKDNFWTENGRALCKPDLACLRQDHNIYKTLLMQLVGQIECDENGFRLADKDLAKTKFNLFIEKAVAENVDLAITPEYSCPWSSIEWLITENKFPSENNIWILGCQSIKPQELKAFTNRNPNVIWIFDEKLVNQNINENKFFDPVCLIFKTKNSNNETKDVFVIQFKTLGFGGEDSAWERDNSITGNTSYVIENERNSTKLIALICSDTLQNIDFTTVKNDYFLNAPLLLVHIQLNAKPFESAYKLYRNLIYLKGLKEDYNKEVICLNWARGVTFELNGVITVFNTYGGSALYCKTDKIDKEDEKINHNHYKGLYYTHWADKRSHIYFLNYDEYVFLIENTKPSQQASSPAQRKRTGPKAKKIFQWNSNWVEIETIDDGFMKICSEIEDNFGNLSCLRENKNYTDVERIIQLSCGDINLLMKENWSQITNLYSFQIDDSEINNRNTFAQDPDNAAYSKRKNKLRKFHFLKNKILSNPTRVPASFVNAILKFDKNNNSKNIYLLNVHSPTNGRKGTAIYLGDKTFSEAKAFKANIESLFNDDQQGKQVMIWYNDPELKRIYDMDNKPEIIENVSKSPVSFKRTK